MAIDHVQGYAQCRLCPELVLTVIGNRTGGICEKCWAGGAGPDLRKIELVGRGYRIRVPMRKPVRSRWQPKDPNHHAAEKAKLRALKRLKATFPDLYDTLLAEERDRAGLKPWPLVAAIRHSWDPDCAETIKFAEVYHALTPPGET